MTSDINSSSPSTTEASGQHASQLLSGLGDTVIVCRQEQFREAAILLSCVSDGVFPMLLVLDDPPNTKEEYLELYNLYISTMRMANEVSYGLVKPELTQVEPIFQAQWDSRECLAPYRSWLKRLLALRNMLMTMRPRRIVYLFSPSDELLKPCSSEGKPDGVRLPLPSIQEQWALLPTGVTWEGDAAVTVLNFTGLGSFYELCCDTWRAHEHREFIGVQADGSTPQFVIALTEALRRGVALRPLEGFVRSIQDACISANSGIGGEHTVLVEDQPNAIYLLAALYAWHTQARIVAVPQPNLLTINAAIAAIQSSKPHPELHDEQPDILQNCPNADATLPRLFSVGKVPQVVPEMERQIQRLELAVSEHMESWVLETVGNAMLTAFTEGTPYAFVKTAGVSWSHKAIGHVAADPDLLVYGELLSEHALQKSYVMNLVFDPGEFHVSESPEVIKSLAEEGTHTLFLSDAAATRKAFLYLASRAPLETIFFVTHGSNNTIKLGDAELRRSDIPQWVDLSSRPVVFNNSCQSWTGVGKEFLRVGARAYIGTLWAVDSNAAITYAQAAMPSIAKGRPIAEALQKSQAPATSRRAYILAGTATVARQWRPMRQLRTPWSFVLEGAFLLLSVLRDLSQDKSQDGLRKQLWVEYRRFKCEFIDATPSLEEHVRLLASEFNVHAVLRHYGTLSLQEVSALYELCKHAMAEAKLSSDERASGLMRLHRDAGRLYVFAGALSTALQAISDGIGVATEAGRSPSELLCDRSEVLKTLGKWSQSIEAAQAALDYSEDHNDGKGALRSIGLLTQLSIRNDDVEAAVQFCERGIAYARELGELREEAVFHNDYGNLLRKIDPQRALDAALMSEKLYAAQQDEQGVLAANGLIGQCLIFLGRLEEAQQRIELGLRKAQFLGDQRREFLLKGDLASIAGMQGDEPKALKLITECSRIAMAIGAFEDVLRFALLRCSRCPYIPDWPNFLGAVTEAIEFMPENDDPLRLTPAIISGLFLWLDAAPTDTLSDEIATLAQKVCAAFSRRHANSDGSPGLPGLIVSVVLLADEWARGGTDAAAMSQRLDEITGNVFELKARFGTPRRFKG